MDLQQELFTALDALTAAGIHHAVCGGFAVAIDGYPRLTRDIDLLIQEAALERARAALSGAGYTIEGGEIVFALGSLARVYRVTAEIGRNRFCDGDFHRSPPVT